MGGAILQTRRFRSGPIDIEILRTAILLSAHQTRHHVGAADPLPVGVPVNVGVANAEGAAVNFARRDHVHNHPAGLGTDLHHAEIHGVAEHTDVTRELFIRPASHTTGTHGFSQNWPTTSLASGVDEGVWFVFKVPDNFVSFTSIRVVWLGTGGTAGQDWRCGPHADYAAAGESYTTHADDPGNITIDVTALTTIYATDLAFIMAALALGDYVGVEITRIGTAGTDTYEGVVRVLGLLFTYIANQ